MDSRQQSCITCLRYQSLQQLWHYFLLSKIVFTMALAIINFLISFDLEQNVMHERSRSAWNPLDKSTQSNTEVLSRILNNTMEQFLIFTSSSTILSIYLKPEQMRIIPIFVVIWVIARLAFDYGYKISPSARGPGFAATAVPSILCLTMLAYYQWLEGPWVLSILAAYFGLKRFYLTLFVNSTSPLFMIFPQFNPIKEK